MRWGLSKVARLTFTIVALACMIMPVCVSLCSSNAEARADFAAWANRSARVLEPGDYNTNGTCACQVCSWKGTQGIGNVGIGNGSVSAFADNTTIEETLYPDYDLQGVITTENSQYPDGNRITGDSVKGPLDFSMGNASGLKIGGTSDVFTYGKPYPGILNEHPVEAAAVYGKLTGLPMPDGRKMSIGVKSIGYEY